MPAGSQSGSSDQKDNFFTTIDSYTGHSIYDLTIHLENSNQYSTVLSAVKPVLQAAIESETISSFTFYDPAAPSDKRNKKPFISINLRAFDPERKIQLTELFAQLEEILNQHDPLKNNQVLGNLQPHTSLIETSDDEDTHVDTVIMEFKGLLANHARFKEFKAKQETLLSTLRAEVKPEETKIAFFDQEQSSPEVSTSPVVTSMKAERYAIKTAQKNVIDALGVVFSEINKQEDAGIDSFNPVYEVFLEDLITLFNSPKETPEKPQEFFALIKQIEQKMNQAAADNLIDAEIKAAIDKALYQIQVWMVRKKLADFHGAIKTFVNNEAITPELKKDVFNKNKALYLAMIQKVMKTENQTKASALESYFIVASEFQEALTQLPSLKPKEANQIEANLNKKLHGKAPLPLGIKILIGAAIGAFIGFVIGFGVASGATAVMGASIGGAIASGTSLFTLASVGAGAKVAAGATLLSSVGTLFQAKFAEKSYNEAKNKAENALDIKQEINEAVSANKTFTKSRKP